MHSSGRKKGEKAKLKRKSRKKRMVSSLISHREKVKKGGEKRCLAFIATLWGRRRALRGVTVREKRGSGMTIARTHSGLEGMRGRGIRPPFPPERKKRGLDLPFGVWERGMEKEYIRERKREGLAFLDLSGKKRVLRGAPRKEACDVSAREEEKNVGALLRGERGSEGKGKARTLGRLLTAEGREGTPTYFSLGKECDS